MEERILAKPAQHSPTDLEHEGREVQRGCFYCLEGGVLLGSIGHDGQEVSRGHPLPTLQWYRPDELLTAGAKGIDYGPSRQRTTISIK